MQFSWIKEFVSAWCQEAWSFKAHPSINSELAIAGSLTLKAAEWLNKTNIFNRGTAAATE
jgi:hypothetical protein